jgi:hypothetical protein
LFGEGWDEAVSSDCDPNDFSKPCYNLNRLGDARVREGIYTEGGITGERSKLVCAHGIEDQHTKIDGKFLSFNAVGGTMTMASNGVKPNSAAGGTVQWSDGYLADCGHMALSMAAPLTNEKHEVKNNVIQNRLHSAIEGSGPGVIQNNWFYNTARSTPGFTANVLQLYGNGWEVNDNFLHFAEAGTNVITLFTSPNEVMKLKVVNNTVFDETGVSYNFLRYVYFQPGDPQYFPSHFVLPLQHSADSAISNNRILGFAGADGQLSQGLLGGISVLLTPDQLEASSAYFESQKKLIEKFKADFGPNWKKIILTKQAEAKLISGYNIKVENNEIYSLNRPERMLSQYYGSNLACAITEKDFNSILGHKANVVYSTIPEKWKSEVFFKPQLHINYQLLLNPDAIQATGLPPAKCPAK